MTTIAVNRKKEERKEPSWRALVGAYITILGSGIVLDRAGIPGLPYSESVGSILPIACYIIYRGWIYRYSNWRLNRLGVGVAIVLGYVAAFAIHYIVHRPSTLSLAASHGMIFLTVGFLVPFLEELVVRGLFLATLLRWTSAPLAVLASSLIAASLHPALVPSLIGNFAIGVAYVVGRRSLTASTLCHVTINVLAFFPSVLGVLSLLRH